MAWMRRLLLGTLLLGLLLAALLGIAGYRARAELARHYPPPGRLVDVGGYRLHLHCLGHGQPTVLLEAGLNEFSVQWTRVQDAAAGFTRTCAYDRAGLGWSEAAPRPRTAAVMVEELHTLLERAGVAGPLVLVGHSFGGLLAREYTRAHPRVVAGVVLVDAAHEAQMERIPFMRQAAGDGVGQFRTLAWVSRVGLLALSPEKIPARGLEGEALARYRALLATTAYFEAAGAETAAFEQNLAAARNRAPGTLGTRPLVVLSRGRPDPLPGLDAAGNRHYEEQWRTLQSALVGLSTRARQVTARDSGHYIHLSEPQLVVAAIREVVQQAR
jgi:pimeloyl-ACP methyl ester carboxylesterase